MANLSRSFLQEASSNLIIREQAVLRQHCLASVTCILSSFRLLDGTFNEKCQLIVRGMFDFQVYACEYWTEYLLYVAESGRGLAAESQLVNILMKFSTRLRLTFQYQGQPEEPSDGDVKRRMQYLNDYPEIFEHVNRSLQARSIEQLERSSKLESGKFPTLNKLRYNESKIVLKDQRSSRKLAPQ